MATYIELTNYRDSDSREQEFSLRVKTHIGKTNDI